MYSKRERNMHANEKQITFVAPVVYVYVKEALWISRWGETQFARKKDLCFFELMGINV